MELENFKLILTKKGLSLSFTLEIIQPVSRQFRIFLYFCLFLGEFVHGRYEYTDYDRTLIFFNAYNGLAVGHSRKREIETSFQNRGSN